MGNSDSSCLQVVGGFDDLIGDSDKDIDSTSESSADGASDDEAEVQLKKRKTAQETTQSRKSATSCRGELRRAAKLVSEEDMRAASELLPPLPDSFGWVDRAPTNHHPPPWTPLPENSPDNSPKLSNRSLLSIFIDSTKDGLEFMVHCTNKSGSTKFPKTWPMLDVPTALLLIAIIFHMDCVQLSSLQMYWEKGNPDGFIKQTGISRNKFLTWYQTIRLYDPDEVTAADMRTNRIYKVEKYLHIVQKSFQKMRNTNCRQLSLDEEMTTFKGRCGLVQMIKGKPSGEGLKYYALCDPKSGYVYSTMLHSSNPVPYENVWGRIVAICYHLLSGANAETKTYLDQGYFVYVNRYYTTVHLNYAMFHRSTYFCGTLRREQRSNLPTDIMMGTRGKQTPIAVKNLKRGHILRRFTSTGETCALSWMDATLVTFLTSINDAQGAPITCNRRVPRKDKVKSGGAHKVIISCPETAVDFSAHMGGVDIHDQNCTTVKSHHKSRRWYVSGVWLQSLDWFAHNSYVLFKDFNADTSIQNREVKDILKKELLNFAKSLQNKDTPNESDEAEPNFKATAEVPTQYDAAFVSKLRLDKRGLHFPIKFLGRNRECQGHMERVQTSYFCYCCHVFLCIEGGCFSRFHTQRDYLRSGEHMSTRIIVRKRQMF